MTKAMSKMTDKKPVFDLEFIADRLNRAVEPSRELDGDIWWILALDDEGREIHGSHGYVLTVMQREGSPGAGLSMFFDSRRNPPTPLDYAMKYTTSVDDALWLVRNKLGNHWPQILCAASLSLMHTADGLVMEDEWRNLPIIILRILVRELQNPTLKGSETNLETLFSLSMFPDFKIDIPLPVGTKPPRVDDETNGL